LGRFCWYELMTSDPDAAPAFYSALTGWGTAGGAAFALHSAAEEG